MPAAKKKPTNTKPKSKTVVNKVLSGRPKWQTGFLAIVVFLLVTSVGYAVYGKFKADSLKAQAANYSYIGTDGVALAYGCKTYIPAYGGVYAVKLVYVKSSLSFPSYYRAATYRGLTVTNNGKQSNLYWNRLVGTQTVNVSAILDDTFRVFLDGQTPNGATTRLTHYESQNLRATGLVNC